MRIEQTLHGYADGHRLLACSVELSKQLRYMMLGLSDISGRKMILGFQEYLTGYPLSDSGFYAFARTWYAPEMERPGCVWTHTLLISATDLGLPRDLGCLRSLFHRPVQQGKGNWEEYSRSLVFSEPEAVITEAPPPKRAVDLSLLGLYGFPELPVFYSAENAWMLEDMIMGLWSQQWPTLRNAFRFCSGAIGTRSSATGQPFDFQVIPQSSIREIRRDCPTSVIVDSESSQPFAVYGSPQPLAMPHWLNRASEEIRHENDPENHSFRQFLRDSTTCGFDGRIAFAPLSELFDIWIALPDSIAGFLELVGRGYPDSKSATRLKSAVAGPGFPLTKSMKLEATESDLLLAISIITTDSAFDPMQLKIPERVSGLWKNDRNAAEQLLASLIGLELNSIGESILLSLIRSLTIEDAIRHSDDMPGLVATAVRLNPEHARCPEVWKGSPEHQRGLFDAATSGGDIPADQQAFIVKAMLQAGSDAAAERATRKFGAVAVHTVMNWFDKSSLTSPWELSEGWRRVLSSQTSTLLDWISNSNEAREASAALIADLSNPHSREVTSRGTEPWLKVLISRNTTSVSAMRNRLDAFLLALGFEAPAGNPDEVVARTFDSVHSALENHVLWENSWEWLDVQLPALPIWRHWDRCERLRRGLVERFVRHEWPIANFLRCASSSDNLKELLKACQKVEGGDRVLKRVKKAVAEKEVRLEQSYLDVVHWYA